MWKLIVITLVIFFPLFSHAQSINAGFVQGLWYAHDQVFADTPTRIYVALRNNTEHDLTGTVRFSVDGVRIGSSDVRALSGRLVEVWVDWTPSVGEHTVITEMTNAELHIIGEEPQSIDIAGVTLADTLFVDQDTDKDGIGNADDDDDDNDGISDEDEIARGNDPQSFNASFAGETGGDESASDIEARNTPEVSEDERGLERFLSEGKADAVVGAITKTIERAKQSVDTYRERRTETRAEESTEIEVPDSESIDTATITHSRVGPDQNLFEKIISLFGALFATLWSFILLVVSFIFGFPAFLELLLLWVILIFIYRTARRYGRRRQ